MKTTPTATHLRLWHRGAAWLVLALLLCAGAASHAAQPIVSLNPLTGLPLAPARAHQRPVLAKLSNAPPLVRPQAGIAQADVVWEHYVEGGLTRFAALFHSTLPERVGSVRSARLIDYELMPMYGALLLYSGANAGVEARFVGSEAAGVDDPRYVFPPSDFASRVFRGVALGAPYYWRDADVPVPHNLFASAQAVARLADAQGVSTLYTPNSVPFAAAAPPGGTPSHGLDVRYIGTRARWDYDPATGLYVRTSDGTPHTDALTGAPVTAANVIVVFAEHRQTDIAASTWQGEETYNAEVILWFAGDALLLRDGLVYNARWERPTRESLLRLVTADAPPHAPLPLKPGVTWVQVMRLPQQAHPGEEWALPF